MKAGDCTFIRRNHRIKMYKNSKGNDVYKGISLVFNRSVLREFYSKMSKSEIPENVKLSDKNVFKIEPRTDITSLFQPLTPYFDENIKPTESITHLKLLEGIYALLNNSDIFFSILFDFTDPWKIDILEFLNDHYMDDLKLKEESKQVPDVYVEVGFKNLSHFSTAFKKQYGIPPTEVKLK